MSFCISTDIVGLGDGPAALREHLQLVAYGYTTGVISFAQKIVYFSEMNRIVICRLRILNEEEGGKIQKKSF